MNVSSSIQEILIQKVKEGIPTELNDFIAIEEPLEIRVSFEEDGMRKVQKVSVTMRTPGEDDELAMGFLFTEGIIKQKKDLLGVQSPLFSCRENKNNTLQIDFAGGYKPQIHSLERNFYTTSSCGVCGKASIEAIKTVSEGHISQNFHWALPQKILLHLPGKLQSHQNVFKATGGLHACALFNEAGDLLQVREDIGRHNALDKLIGSFFLQDSLPLDRFILLLSGRASFELVQKAAMARIPIVASVGAPSSLAISLAHEMGITLIGFLSEKRFNIYTHKQRIIIKEI